MLHLWEKYIRTCRKGERQVIQIEIGNGTSIRRIGLMPGRNASTVSREIKRNTWFRPTRTSPTGRTGRNG